MILSFLAVSKEEPIKQIAQHEILLTKDPVNSTVIMVQEQYTDRLMNTPEVIGTAIGLTEDGRQCILVLTKTDISAARGKTSLPAQIENIPIRMMVTGSLSNQEISLMKILMPTLRMTDC